MGHCDPGLQHTAELVVTDEHTAAAVGSGDMPVLATPALLTLAECTCMEALGDEVPDGQTSVGTFAEVEHDRPTPVGETVRAEATLIGHHGRRLEFQVIVREGEEIVARVRHRRVLIDRETFLEKVGAASV